MFHWRHSSPPSDSHLLSLQAPRVTVCFAPTGPPEKPQPPPPPASVYEASSKCLCGLIPCFSNGSAVGKQFPLQMSHKHYEMPQYYCVSTCMSIQRKMHSHTVVRVLVWSCSLRKKSFLLSRLFHLLLHSWPFFFFFHLSSCYSFPEPASGVSYVCVEGWCAFSICGPD